MIFQLRRNTIMSDWYKAVDHYRYMIGYDINYAIVNIKTLKMMEYYSSKHKDVLIVRNFENVDERGHVIYRLWGYPSVTFCGVNIIIDNSIEDERIKFY